MTAAGSIDVSLLSGGHDVADARLHRIVDALSRAGLRVEVFALGDPANAPSTAASVRTHPRKGHARRLLDAVLMPMRARGAVLVAIAPDAAPATWFVARLRRRAVAVDLFEDYLLLAHDRPLSRPARLAASGLVRVALAVAARADVTSVADEHVPPARARRRLVVRNLPDGDYLPAPGVPDPQPRAIYIGDVRRSRGLETMLEALASAPDWHLDVVGEVAPADRPWLEQWRTTSPAASRVTFHGRQPPREAWRLAPGAWVGLALLDDTPAFRVAMPSKLYEYLAVGLPVLVTALPRMAALVEQTQAGAAVAGADDAADVLSAWAADPAPLLSARERARRWADNARTAPSPYDELARAYASLVRDERAPDRAGAATRPSKESGS